MAIFVRLLLGGINGGLNVIFGGLRSAVSTTESRNSWSDSSHDAAFTLRFIPCLWDVVRVPFATRWACTLDYQPSTA